MHPFQLEQLVRKLDARVTRIEQLLPTLATKDDLRDAMANLATNEELKTGLEEARRHALMLNDATRGDIRVVAEHLLAVRAQFDRINARLDRLDGRLERMDTRLVGLESRPS